MMEFINNYWRIIVDVLTIIVSLIIWLIKKKPVINEMDNIILKVLEKLPEWINAAEVFTGADVKKSIVLESAKKFVKTEFHLTLSQPYIDFIGSRIEDILSTPTKK